MKSHRMITAVCCAVASLAAATARAEVYTWLPTVTGTAYNWNNTAGQDNWSIPAAFANAAGDTANLTSNLTGGGQTISLQQDITVGTLNLGDADGSHAFTIAAGTVPTNQFIFQSLSGPAQLNLGATGVAANAFSGNVLLNSATVLNVAGTQRLNFAGETNLNGQILTIGGAGTGLVDFGTTSTTGKITGMGTIIKNNSAIMTIANASNIYSGNVRVNNGKLVLVTGKLNSASAIHVSGYTTPTSSTAITQNGGVLEVGNLSGQALNPGQRLTTNTVSFDGGHFNYIGQLLTAPSTEIIQDNIANLTFNSGYTMVTIGAATNTAGSVINATSLNRNNGATVAVRSATLGGTARVLAGNIATNDTYLRGDPSGTGTSTRVIPWIVANNTNNGSANPATFATYTPTGLRALIAGEFDTGTIIGTPTRNMVIANAALGTNVQQTVNSLSLSTTNSVNIGSGSVLTVTSGGVMFTGGSGPNGAIGAAGDAAAGTLAFGAAEGVIWSLAQNTNGIGAVITGTGGLTKAGVGTLTLSGNNQYTGKTFVSAGTLRVGNGVQSSNLGTGDVFVAVAATLRISTAGAIGNSATLTLDTNGMAGGKLIVDAGYTEQIAGLVLGGVSQLEGYYGSVAAAALANPSLTVITNDTYFGGTGLLQVAAAPEPASAGLIVLASAGLLRRRKRDAGEARTCVPRSDERCV